MNHNSDNGAGFDWFEDRAKDEKSINDENHRLGFSNWHRNFDLQMYCKSIFSTLFSISVPKVGNIMLDIGAGGGSLAKLFESECLESQLGYVMVDTKNIWNKGFVPLLQPIYGQFPKNARIIEASDYGQKIQYVMVNSVIHYVKNDGILVDFVIALGNLLQEGGVAFIGDVPTLEMKVAQAKANGTLPSLNTANNFSWNEFAILGRLLAEISCSLYILPQPRFVPMHPHRSDLLVVKHQLIKQMVRDESFSTSYK